MILLLLIYYNNNYYACYNSDSYLTIPRAQMGSESIALRDHEGERNNICFNKIQPVGQKNIETKHLLLVKARL